MSTEIRYDFIVVKLNESADPDVVAGHLAERLGAKPEKLRLVFAHIKEKGPVAIEKAVTRERLAELKQIWEEAGVATAQKENLTIVDVLLAPAGPAMFKCPACGHEQEPPPEPAQCVKCGVFAHKFLEQQKKNELYLREKEKLERINEFRRMKEEQEAREAAEAAELEAIRRRLEEEMGGKGKGRFAWLTGTGPGSTAARSAISGLVLAALLGLGWFGRDLFDNKDAAAEKLAKQQAAQAKQNATQMQAMVGNLIKGSKKMAQTSGAAEQFQQALFAQGDKDAELQEQLTAAQTGSEGTKDALADIDRAEGLSGAAKTFAESGGNVDDAERALSASMQSAKQIKDAPKRAEAVSAVASSQLEVHAQDAREKASNGDWRAADKSFSKALAAAGDISSKPDQVAARGSVAKVRADTGDYGGATLLFLDSMKGAEELPDPRARAIALADVARQMAQSTNDIDGAAGRAFEKALAAGAGVKTDAERVALTNEVVLRRAQATCDVAGFLLSAKDTAKEAKPLLERAGKDVDAITDPLLQARALGAHARVTAEYEGDTPAVQAQLARVAKLAESAPEASRDLMIATALRTRVEVTAAAAKFIAVNGEKVKAKQAFLAAMKASNTIVTKSADPVIRSDVAKQRTEALGTLARYMQAAGDKQAAAKVFQLAVKSADPAQAPKALAAMVLASRGN